MIKTWLQKIIQLLDASHGIFDLKLIKFHDSDFIHNVYASKRFLTLNKILNHEYMKT